MVANSMFRVFVKNWEEDGLVSWSNGELKKAVSLTFNRKENLEVGRLLNM